MYAATAARTLQDRATLEKLGKDADDNVREAAIQGLSALVGHGADPIYIDALGRTGYQVLRVSALALAGTRDPQAAASLKAAHRRLVEEGRDNSTDARTAIAETLRGMGEALEKVRLKPDTTKNSRGVRLPLDSARGRQADLDMTASDLRRLSGARARVAIRGVGTFELALLTAEAPASAFRFAKLAESGYYNGLTFHRVVPNFVIQGGSPGANEYIGDASFMRDELGQWPHVRGAVGISTRGRDTGDAQMFIDLVDIPRLDHEYTVFAHVLNGMDVVDRILEGDVIDRIEILTGS
jgi:peptidyl-prolyl cis-trans isomerase B (cyclophilin B)